MVDAQVYTQSFTGASQTLVMSGLNYSTLGISARGTRSAGNLICEVCVDGITWQAIDIYRGTTALSGGLIIAAGSYRSSIAGYGQVRISSSSDFAGNLLVTADPSPAFFLEGVVGDITDVTATLPLLSSGGTAPDISVSGLTTVGSALDIVTSTGSAWAYIGSNGTGTVVRTNGATVTNFTVTGRVTESDTFTAGATFAAGEVGYLGPGGTVLKASNAAVATAEGMMLVASTAISSAASGVFIGRGRITISGASFTVGGKIYLGAAGALTQTAPTATTTAIRILGYAFSSTVMSFMPDNTTIENV